MEDKIVNLKVKLGSSEEDVKALGKAFKSADLEATKLDATFEEIYGDLQPLNTRMGEQEDRLYELALAGKQSSREYKELLKSVANYKQIQIQTDLVVDAAATKLFPKLTQSLNAVAGGFSIAQGSIGLFGTESEDVEKAMLKVQSAMAISQGFESINQSKDSIISLGTSLKQTTLFQKAQAAATLVQSGATAVLTFVTTGATVATKLFRAALVATGIGAIILLVGLLVTNFDKLKKVFTNIFPSLSKLTSFFGNVVNAVTDFVGATSEASRTLSKFKDDADKTLAINKKFLSEHSDQIDEYTKKKIDAKNEYATAVKEENADTIALAKKLNRQLADIEFSRGDEKRKIQKESNEKAAALGKAAREKAAADLKAQRDAELAELMASATEALSIVTTLQQSQETPAEKENREYQEKKTVLEANNLDTELLEKIHQDNLNKITTDSFIKDADLAIKKTADNKAENDKRIEDDKAVAEAKAAILMSELNNASAGIALAKGLFEKSKSVQKAALVAESAIGIAKIIINTQAANAAAKLKYALLPGGLALAAGEILSNKIGAGIGIASNVAATAKGLSALGGGSAPGGAVGGGGGGGAAAPAAPAFNVIGASPANQLAQTIGAQNNIPIKAFVVSSEVSTAQALDRNIIKSATLG
jgi:hypothetical protein